jgi:hypothetical protein
LSIEHQVKKMLPETLKNPQLVVGTAVIGLLVGVALLRYQNSIQHHLKLIQNSIFFGKPKDPFRMIRTEGEQHEVPSELSLVALDANYTKRHPDWRLVSLGDYISTLRPQLTATQHLPAFIETEAHAALASSLMKALGPTYGAAVLPAVGAGFVQKAVTAVANKLASFLLTSKDRIQKKNEDLGRVPYLSLFALMYIAEVNYDRLKGKPPVDDDAVTPIALFRQGEAGYTPSFAGNMTQGREESKQDDKEDSQENETASSQLLVPNPFVISKDWDIAIESMELLLQSQDGFVRQSTSQETSKETSQIKTHTYYEPNSKEMKKPVPVDERFLPDLHIGFGSAKCTHTQREILKNRLLSVLLNRLASNYYYRSERLFEVHMDDDKSSKKIARPSEFIEALVDSGHSVEACVTTHITTFGIGLCVKEIDDIWTNIPLAVFMSNGYSDAEGKEAFTCLPHSGLSLEIQGPLLANGCIQHFMGIEGICGWFSNHNADVPWLERVECGEPVQGAKVADAVRIAALQATVMNTVSTKFRLPFGGYGLTGVCNDSAGLIEYAMSRKTHIYPLSFSGRWSMHNLRLARELMDKLRQDPSMNKEVDALQRLIDGIAMLSSDISSLPSEAEDQYRRLVHCLHPEMPFKLQHQTKEVMESVLRELKESRS